MTSRPAGHVPARKQIDAVTRDTDLVIAGVGGNDVGFGPIIESVLTPSLWGALDNATPEINRRAGQIPQHQERWTGLFEQILDRMDPDGDLLVTGYPQITPERIPGDTDVSGLDEDESRAIRQLVSRLNEALRQAAQDGREAAEPGPEVGFVDQEDAFAGSELLSGNDAVNGIGVGADRVQMSYHPNARGLEILGRRLADALRQPLNRQIYRAPTAPPGPGVDRGEGTSPEALMELLRRLIEQLLGGSLPATPPATPGPPGTTNPTGPATTRPATTTTRPATTRPPVVITTRRITVPTTRNIGQEQADAIRARANQDLQNSLDAMNQRVQDSLRPTVTSRPLGGGGVPRGVPLPSPNPARSSSGSSGSCC